jgi:hypothetical protein
MQNDDIIQREISNNKNSMFISESIKDIISLKEDSNTETNKLFAVLDDKSQYPVLSYVKKNNKSIMLLQVDDLCLNSVILETLSKIDILVLNKVIKTFEIDKFSINYGINYLENNIYLLKIKAWRKTDGI